MKNLFVPFRGIRYNLERVKLEEVVTPPYDVITPTEQEKYYQRDPHSAIRLDLAKGEVGDSEISNRYTRAAADYRKWLEEGFLIQEKSPSFYLYEQTFSIEGRKETLTRRGILGLRRLESFGKGQFAQGKIFPHEKTIAGPKADRLLLMKACRANFSPVFGIYSDPEGRIKKRVESLFQQSPLADFEQEGVRHRFWVISGGKEIEEISSSLSEKNVVIADGHHRYETALNYLTSRLSSEADASEEAPFRYVLMYLAHRDEAVVQPTHRVVRNIPRFEKEKLLAHLRKKATVTLLDEKRLSERLSAADSRRCRFGIAFPPNDFHLVEMEGEVLEIPPLLRSLDVAVAHKVLLEDFLCLSKEEETHPRFVEFVKSRKVALQALQDATVQFVLLMTPPDLVLMEKVVQSGLTMPPKTTYFYPKLLTGLVINPL